MPYNIQWDPEPCLDSSYWPHEQPSYKILIEGGCFKLEQRYSFAFSKFRPAVCCEHCKFCVYVENWNQECSPHHGNPWGAHVHKSSQCPLIISYLADLKERMKLIEEVEQARIAKERAEPFTCRRCPARFPSNIKLHQHVQDHHQKPTKSACEIAKPTPSELAKIIPSETATSPSTPKAESVKITTTAEPTPKAVATMPTPSATPPSTSEPAVMLTPPSILQESISDHSLPLTPPATPISTSTATPRKQISWAEIASRPVIAPKPSRLPVPTPKRRPNIAEIAPVTCPPTPLATPSYTPDPKHQKPYLTIEDLFEMFDGKPKRMDLLHTKNQNKKGPSSPKISCQAKITSYFRPAVNQNKTISQASKTPNPKSFHQHMPAEPNRTTPSKWSEKSPILPYKTSTFSHLPTSEILGVLPYKMPVISDRLPRLPTPRAPFGISASCHSCRICRGTFGSNNGLHRHLRAIHFDQAPRQRHENLRKHDREHRRNPGSK